MTEYFKGIQEVRGSIDAMDINSETLTAMMKGKVTGMNFIATGESPESPETFVGAMREKLRDFVGAYKDLQHKVTDMTTEMGLANAVLHESQQPDYQDRVASRLREFEKEAAAAYANVLKFGQTLEFLRIPPDTVRRIYDGVVDTHHYPLFFEEEEVPF